jgi:hypothetical protein
LRIRWGGRTRTFNFQNQNLTLYQLNYTPKGADRGFPRTGAIHQIPSTDPAGLLGCIRQGSRWLFYTDDEDQSPGIVTETWACGP